MTRYALIPPAISAVALIAAFAFATPGLAQTDPAAAPTAPEAAAPAVAPSRAELQALAFYIQQKDQPSVDAELRRLRAKFPGWVPPADLSRLTITQPSSEIDTIYRQIAAGQLAEARATIATTQTAYGDWVPPPDMISLLETAEGQTKLDAALDAGNANEALTIASNTDGLLRCDRVNNAWRIAKAQENQQALAAALGTYTAIIGACTVFPDIVATLEKADSVTSDAELAALFEAARARFPAKATELATVQRQLMLGRGANPADIALDLTPKAKPAAKIAEKAPVVETAPKAPVARTEAPVEKAPVEKAPARGAAASGGAGCLAATHGAASAGRMAERGWCAYNLDQPMEALAAFQSAESRLKGAQRRDARFGMALSYLKMNMTEEASRLAASTAFTNKQRVETESIILDQRGVLAYKKKQYRKAIGYFDALEQISGRLRRDLAVLRGYAYLNSGNKSKAKAEFQRLNDQLATPETRKALAAASADD